MAFVKELKTSKYFSNFTTKRRRRREGKTDYRLRRMMLTQDLCAYGRPKYRLVVRRTQKRIICQIIYGTLIGDKTICQADSFDLKNYGLEVGLTNYASAYCVGLLCARRLLTKIGLADQFEGVEEADGEMFEPEEEEQAPFRAILDIGLYRSSIGARVFGAMKGAVDGGILIPHNEKCFPGYTPGKKGDDNYSAEEHLERILGQHVANYQSDLQEEQPEKYQTLFSRYIKAGIKPEDIPDMYRGIHAKIRENPQPKAFDRAAKKAHCKAAQRPKQFKKLTNEERKARVQHKLALIAERMA